jgi:hypothetical protein
LEFDLRIHDQFRIRGQAALLGHVPASLRAVSVALEGKRIRFRAIFDRGASADDRDHLQLTGAYFFADFTKGFTFEEEILEVPAPQEMEHLETLLFHRAEEAA